MLKVESSAMLAKLPLIGVAEVQNKRPLRASTTAQGSYLDCRGPVSPNFLPPRLELAFLAAFLPDLPAFLLLVFFAMELHLLPYAMRESADIVGRAQAIKRSLEDEQKFRVSYSIRIVQKS